MIVFVLVEEISFTQISFFLLAISFLIGRNCAAMHGWQKIVFMKQHCNFFSRNTSDCFCLLKLLLESLFAVISSQNLKIYSKIAIHALRFRLPIHVHPCSISSMRLPPGKISLHFKTMKNTKIADLVLSLNSSYD